MSFFLMFYQTVLLSQVAQRSRIGHNTAQSEGGGLHISDGGSITVSDSTLEDNIVNDGTGGGAAIDTVDTVQFSNVNWTHNRAFGSQQFAYGGGLFAKYISDLQLTGNCFTGNTAENPGHVDVGADGGAIFVDVSVVVVSDSSFSSNQVSTGCSVKCHFSAILTIYRNSLAYRD